MKKILIIAPECPYPANSGGRLRVYHLVKQLAMTHHVSLVYFSPTEQMPPKELIGLVKECYPLVIKDNRHNALAQLMKVVSLVTGSFSAINVYADMDILAAIQQIISNDPPDIIMTETSYLLPIPQYIRRTFPDSTLILDAHNMEHRLHAAMGRSATNPFVKLQKWLTSVAIKKVEKQANDYINAISAVSAEEVQHWQQLCPNAQILLVPNGVDVDYFKPRQNSSSELSLVYCGLMDYRPNVEGVLWFVAAVWPRVVQLFPEIKLYVVGRNPTESVKRLSLSDQRIIVTGTVDDVRDWVANATISIVPLLSGGGTRLKILEAMALGKVVISTKMGAEGIQPSAGLLVATTADQFVLLIKKYLSSPLATLGASNRLMVEKYYAWPIVIAELNKYINSKSHL